MNVETTMHFEVRTKVGGHYRQVFAKFDQDLLLKLVMPGMKLQLLHFDYPPKVGGKIHIRVTIFGMIKQEWKNDFTSYTINENECAFVDEGRQMPWPLKQWRHNHRVVKIQDGTEIVDDVTFATSNKLLDVLMFPVVWMQFRYRRPIYRRELN
jgi:ligand-binding SRPBCC domain-containing protein